MWKYVLDILSSLIKCQTFAGLNKFQYALDLSLKEKAGSLSLDFIQRLSLKEEFSMNESKMTSGNSKSTKLLKNVVIEPEIQVMFIQVWQ